MTVWPVHLIILKNLKNIPQKLSLFIISRQEQKETSQFTSQTKKIILDFSSKAKKEKERNEIKL